MKNYLDSDAETDGEFISEKWRNGRR